MKFSPSQKRSFQLVRDSVTETANDAEWLEQVRKEAPQYEDEVRELIDVRDHLASLCEGCLAAALPPPPR